MTKGAYDEWEETLAELAAGQGTTLLLGGVDVGKTTFCRLLVNRAVAGGEGRRIAVLDGDVGQSEIGPPACVGLAFAAQPVAALSELTPHALAFVGSTTPQSHLLEHVGAVRRLADRAEDARLIVDTSGYLHGSGARRLNQTEFDLLSPAHVVALQRNGELEPILAPMRRREGCRVHTPPIPSVIGRKPPAFRAQRRAMRWAAYFHESAAHVFAFDEVALVGTWLGGGAPVAAHLLRFLGQTLGARAKIYYAELSDRHLGLMVSAPIPANAPEIGVAMEPFRADSISITVAPQWKHLLVGLESGGGKLLGLGSVETLDFRRRTLGIRTPVRAPAAARIVRLGALRVTPEGKEVGTVRPGDL